MFQGARRKTTGRWIDRIHPPQRVQVPPEGGFWGGKLRRYLDFLGSVWRVAFCLVEAKPLGRYPRAGLRSQGGRCPSTSTSSGPWWPPGFWWVSSWTGGVGGEGGVGTGIGPSENMAVRDLRPPRHFWFTQDFPGHLQEQIDLVADQGVVVWGVWGWFIPISQS